jgi:F0F1-type ATP synthase delta subunit
MKPMGSPTETHGFYESAALMQRESHALRTRVRVLREDLQRARFEYLQALLTLRTKQGKAAACDRITRQLKNLLNEQRPRKARKEKA